MKKLITLFALSCCALTGVASASDVYDPSQPKTDRKNVIVSIGDLVILRSNDASSSNLNNSNAYLEAYNKYTGQRVWALRDTGVIVSYDVIDPYTIVYRNLGRLTAVNIQTGTILWSTNTLGPYSIVAGE